MIFEGNETSDTKSSVFGIRAGQTIHAQDLAMRLLNKAISRHFYRFEFIVLWLRAGQPFYLIKHMRETLIKSKFDCREDRRRRCVRNEMMNTSTTTTTTTIALLLLTRREMAETPAAAIRM